MRKEVRPWLRFLFILAVVAVAAWIFFDSFDIEGFLAYLSGANVGLVVVAIVVYAASWPLRGARYREILAGTGHVCGTAAMTGAVFVSQTSNLVVPARAGDGARAYIVKKRNGVPYTSGAASLAAERILDLVAVLLLGGLGLVLTFVTVGGFTPRRGGDAVVAAVVAGGVTVVAVVALFLARGRVLGRIPEAGTEKLEAVVGAIRGFVADFGSVFKDTKGVLRLGSASLAIWTLDVATCVVLFYALGVTFEGVVAVSLVAVSVGNLAKVVPATPGGIGLYEAGFAAVVVGATGVGWEAAVAVAVLDHALKNGVTVIGGVGSALTLNVSLTSPAESEAEA